MVMCAESMWKRVGKQVRTLAKIGFMCALPIGRHSSAGLRDERRVEARRGERDSATAVSAGRSSSELQRIQHGEGSASAVLWSTNLLMRRIDKSNCWFYE